MTHVQKVILDVDVGTDDALALLLFLFAEVIGLVKLQAITCVNGNTKLDNVVVNVMRLLEAADRTDIPVYIGSKSTLIPPEINGDGFHGDDGFGDLKWNRQPDLSRVQPEIAAVAIGELVMQNPGEINIVALGPLTNIALALKLFPEMSNNVKSINVMGGNYKAIGNISPAAEFNFYLDPESARIVFNEAKTPITVTTWESIIASNISVDWRFNVLGRIRNPVMDLITRADRTIYPKKAKKYNPPDAFAAAAFLFPDYVIEDGGLFPATIELHGSETRGQVVINHRNDTTPNAKFLYKFHDEAIKNVFLYAANVTGQTFKFNEKMKSKFDF